MLSVILIQLYAIPVDHDSYRFFVTHDHVPVKAVRCPAITVGLPDLLHTSAPRAIEGVLAVQVEIEGSK